MALDKQTSNASQQINFIRFLAFARPYLLARGPAGKERLVVILIDRYNPFRKSSSQLIGHISVASGSNHAGDGAARSGESLADRIGSLPHPHGPLSHGR